MDMSLSKLQELVMDRKACRAASPRGHKELDTTERVNWTELKYNQKLNSIFKYVFSSITLDERIEYSVDLVVLISIMKFKSIHMKVWIKSVF